MRHCRDSMSHATNYSCKLSAAAWLPPRCPDRQQMDMAVQKNALYSNSLLSSAICKAARCRIFLALAWPSGARARGCVAEPTELKSPAQQPRSAVHWLYQSDASNEPLDGSNIDHKTGCHTRWLSMATGEHHGASAWRTILIDWGVEHLIKRR